MSRRAAPLANQWWSQRFTAVLEGYGLGPRMERGRRYARGGRVEELLVKAGRLEARVQGSRATPYRVSVRSAAPSKAQWKALEQAMAARLGWTAQLLNGEVPRDLEEPFEAVGVPLFPRRWSDLQVRCGCPDDAVPCTSTSPRCSTCSPIAWMRTPGCCWPGMAATASSCWPACAAMPPNRPTPRACRPGGPWACGPAQRRASSPPTRCRPIYRSGRCSAWARWSCRGWIPRAGAAPVGVVPAAVGG